MKSARLLPLSHWAAFLVVGLYPLYSEQQFGDWAWIAATAGLAFLGCAYHLARRLLPPGGVGWQGFLLVFMDAALICFLINYSGGIVSPLFPLLFLLVATASLYDHWTKALTMAALISVCYIAACLLRDLDLAASGANLLVNVFTLLSSSVLLSYLAELDRREHSRAERIEALYRLSSELMEKVDLEETLRHLLSSASSLFRTDICSVRLLDRKTGMLVLAASAAPRGELGEQIEIAVGEGFIGWVAKEKQPIIINDVQGDPRFACFPRARSKVCSALAAPIQIGGNLVGVLSFASTQPRIFSQEDLQMLVTISNLAASIVSRSELYQMVVSRSEVIVDSMSSGLLITDATGRVVLANQACRDLLGLDMIPDDISLRELLDSTLLDTHTLWENMDGERAGDQGQLPSHLEMRLRGTPERIFSVSVSPIAAAYEPNSGSVVIMEDITERVKVDEIRDDLMLLIARRVEEQTALYEVGKSLVDELDTRNLLGFLLSKAVDLVDAQFGALSLREEDALFRIKAVHGLDPANLELPLVQEDCLASEALTGQTPVCHSRITAADSVPWGGGLSFPFSYLAAPITWQGEVTGLIEVASYPSHRSFGDDDLRLLGLFVNQAAIALENYKLYRLVTEDQRRMEAMLHSISDGVIAVSNDARVILVNAAAERILHLPHSPVPSRRHIKEVIRNPDLENLFLKSLHSQQEMEWEVSLALPERKILEVHTSLIETSPGEQVGIIAIIRDVTALRELEQAKDDFVSTVSHELRTPLTSIKAYTATMRRGDVKFDDGTRQEFLKIIEEETDRLARLISDLLDISRIESGRMELKQRDLDLRKLAEIVVEKMGSQADNHTIRLRAPDEALVAYADPDKIEQVLMNLLDNAVKYSPTGGAIDVVLLRQRHMVEFSVSDRGVGIPEEHLLHIFDKFHRVDNRATREIYGTGLGLYVSKSIIESHGGTIWAESRSGEGSTFHFTLPLAIPAGGEAGNPASLLPGETA